MQDITPGTRIVPTLIKDQFVIVEDDPLTIEWDPFTWIPPDSRYFIRYYLELLTPTGYKPIEIDKQSLFTFVQEQRSSKLTIIPTLDSEVKLYALRIKGKFTPHTLFENFSYFFLSVKHRCLRNEITPNDISPRIDYTFTEGDLTPVIY